MEDVARLDADASAISCIDMHTTGEPTRIIYRGYPKLQGHLLEQRAQAQSQHDHIRRRLILEPRGHADMYGAVLRPETEMTRSGEAHMGVLFLTNEGYSTMCGHATIALGRFLIDTHDELVFPARKLVRFDAVTRTVALNLHAPCGLVRVTVPTNEDGSRSDSTRPVSHILVPSFATGVNVQIDVPHRFKWPELQERDHVTADFSYGGAFYCLIHARELGFTAGLTGKVDIPAMNTATRLLKAVINARPDLKHLFSHPNHNDLGFLYSIIVVDTANIGLSSASSRAETGLCFFANQQIDRSPTGSGVAARVALAYAKDANIAHHITTYHSLLSRSKVGRGGFNGRVSTVLSDRGDHPVVNVQVEGFASYISSATYVVERSDPLSDDGFLLEELDVV